MLNKPILLYSSSFDGTKEKIFEFNVVGTTAQITANRLIVRKQSNNEIVYNQVQNTFKYEHILPPDTLINGEYYNAVISVLDAKGEESQPSAPIQFKCYTEPTLAFTNIPATGIINNSSFSFEFEYNQKESEFLGEYSVNLYNASQLLISSSGDMYVQDGRPPFKSKYLFTGLEDNATYFVEVTGKTVNGAIVTTGKVKFDADYKLPDLFALLVLENNCQEGTIKVGSNIVLIDATTNPDPPVFIEDKEIDLSKDGDYVNWSQGYNITGDFIARGWFRKPNDYKQLIKFSNTSGESIEIKFMKGYESTASEAMSAYIQVLITSVKGMEHFIISNYIQPLSDDAYYGLQLRRVNGVYQVELKPIV